MDIVERFLSTARSQIEEYYVELWREHESSEPEHLFHYTSTEGARRHSYQSKVLRIRHADEL
jgi:hypothetical protein